jgi:hypothetical protein
VTAQHDQRHVFARACDGAGGRSDGEVGADRQFGRNLTSLLHGLVKDALSRVSDFGFDLGGPKGVHDDRPAGDMQDAKAHLAGRCLGRCPGDGVPPAGLTVHGDQDRGDLSRRIGARSGCG